MRRMMKFANQYEYDKWTDYQEGRCEHTDEIVCVVDDGAEDEVESVDNENDVCNASENATTNEQNGDAENPTTAREGYKMTERITTATESVDEDKITLADIAEEFATQEQGFDEMWSYNHRGTNDYLVQYWYTWYDEYGRMGKDHVDIFLSDACRSAGVEFDVVDEDAIEGRMLAEMVDRGYTVDDDGDIVIDDDMDEYSICGEIGEIRSELWEAAQNEAEKARDELCEHEDLSEPWFRELCEKMLAKVNATLAE